jgi:ParB family chromosome partitioning protein
MADRKLGRGLDGLLQGLKGAAAKEPLIVHRAVTTLSIASLDPNPYQPRQDFATEDLDHLKASILEHGVLQPIIVRRHRDRYQIIAGERRFRAAQSLGMHEVPVVVRDVPDGQMLELALVENLQREDLDPIEKATSFKSYLASSGKTQEEASKRLGLDRSTISNILRLLELPDEVQTMVRKGLIMMGHARAILAIEGSKRQMEVAARVVREGLSVRQVEHLATRPKAGGRKRKAPIKGAEVRDLEARLRDALGTKVTVEEGGKPGTGKIVIEFYSHEDLERILTRIE